jgi:hypothetical protein
MLGAEISEYYLDRNCLTALVDLTHEFAAVGPNVSDVPRLPMK